MQEYLNLNALLMVLFGGLFGWAARGAYVEYQAREAARLLDVIQKSVERRIALKSKPKDPAAIAEEAREAAVVELIKDEVAGLK